jgi:hypothetical protein
MEMPGTTVVLQRIAHLYQPLPQLCAVCKRFSAKERCKSFRIEEHSLVRASGLQDRRQDCVQSKGCVGRAAVGAKSSNRTCAILVGHVKLLVVHFSYISQFLPRLRHLPFICSTFQELKQHVTKERTGRCCDVAAYDSVPISVFF